MQQQRLDLFILQ